MTTQINRQSAIALFAYLFSVSFAMNINADELNLEVQHEDDPSDMSTNVLDDEKSLLPPLVNKKNQKKISFKGDVLITEEILQSREVDGAEIKMNINTD
jgi:hypothetical protein